mmetsp:Transcript_12279/g.38929  ORF Transcript_12279/g.38929 Transcript_12279/m.38929 type:complete len:201 (-) Transcript_12279:176-778(-)
MRLDGLEQGDLPRDVGVHVRPGVLGGIPHPCLRRQVQHVRELAQVEDALQHPGVVEVRLHRVHPCHREVRRARALERHRVVVVEVVQAQHPVPTAPQGLGRVEAHKPARARDQHRDLLLAVLTPAALARPEGEVLIEVQGVVLGSEAHLRGNLLALVAQLEGREVLLGPRGRPHHPKVLLAELAQEQHKPDDNRDDHGDL